MIHWQPGMKLDEVEKQVILKAYRFFDMNKTKTADALGISVRTIQNKLKEYGVDNGEESNLRSEVGHDLESDAQVPAQQPLPMSERKEVQEVLPAQYAGRVAAAGKRGR